MNVTQQAPAHTIYNVNLKKSLLSTTMIATMSLLASNVANAAVAADELPTGEQVLGGAVAFDRATPSQLNMTQGTNRAVVQWSSFNIGSSATVNVAQPTNKAVLVNTVNSVSTNPSEILGSLNSNGVVMVLNPNGVLFGNNAHIDVGGIIASTGSLDNKSFIDNGTIALSGMTKGNITNNSNTFTVKEGGLAAFVAPSVVNNGTIVAKLGTVTLAAAEAAHVTIDAFGDGLVELDTGRTVGTGVSNSNTGKIEAQYVELTTKQVGNVVNSLINMGGIVEAHGATVNDAGVITLKTDSNESVKVANSARIDADIVDMQSNTTVGTGVITTVKTVNVSNNATKSVQGAHDIVNVGGTINLAAGTYDLGTTSFNYTKNNVTLKGASQAGTVLDGSKIGANKNTINLSANGAVISDLTVIGGGHYGIKATGDNLRLTNLTSTGSYRTEIDMNGVDSAWLNNITATGAGYGAGVSMTNATNINLSNITTNNNSFGGIAIYNGETGVHGVTLTGVNHLNEANKLYTETEATKTGTITNLKLGNEFGYAMVNTGHRPTGADFVFYQQNEAEAVNLAKALGAANTAYVQTTGVDGNGFTTRENNFIVGNGLSIQTALNAANTGATVNVRDGVYAEQLSLNKKVTIDGGDNTVLRYNGTNNGSASTIGVTVSADDVTLSDLTIENYYSGIAVNKLDATIKNLTLNDVASQYNTYDGLHVATRTGLDGLHVTGSSFSNNSSSNGGNGYGWYFAKDDIALADRQSNTSTVTNVDAINTVFNSNAVKGIYAEKLNNATFTNITVDGSGGNTTNQFGSVGVDINLKNGIYKDITFNNLTVSNSGVNSVNNGVTKSGAAVWIKARNDGTTYSVTPATLTNLNINNSNITTLGDVGLGLSNNISGVNVNNTYVTGPQAVAVFGTISGIKLTGNHITSAGTSSGGKLDSYTSSGNNTIALYSNTEIDATEGNYFNGVAAADMSLSQLYALEDTIKHGLDSSAGLATGIAYSGLVRTVDGNVYVTTNSGSIQRGVDKAVAGDTVNVADGTYSGNVSVAKNGITIDGGASTKLQGTGAGNGIAVSADDVTLSDLIVDKYATGIYVDKAGTVNDLALSNVISQNNINYGLFVSNYTTVDGLDISQSAFNNNDYGMYFFKKITDARGVTVTDVNVTDTSFNGNKKKGIYAEKLENATFTNIAINGSGTDDTFISQDVGIDINLKYGDYENITFDNLTVINSGENSVSGGKTLSGSAVWIKARNEKVTSTDYNVDYSGSIAASLTGLVIKNSDITAAGDVALAIGNNIDSVEVSNNNITGPQALTVYGTVRNVTLSGNDFVSSGIAKGILERQFTSTGHAVGLYSDIDVDVTDNSFNGVRVSDMSRTELASLKSVLNDSNDVGFKGNVQTVSNDVNDATDIIDKVSNFNGVVMAESNNIGSIQSLANTILTTLLANLEPAAGGNATGSRAAPMRVVHVGNTENLAAALQQGNTMIVLQLDDSPVAVIRMTSSGTYQLSVDENLLSL